MSRVGFGPTRLGPRVDRPGRHDYNLYRSPGGFLMTTEDDFQRALDAHPDDWQTRVVFADWLEERGDPRAAGYRALGQGCYQPAFYPNVRERWEDGEWSWWRGLTGGVSYEGIRCCIPQVWWEGLVEPIPSHPRKDKNYPIGHDKNYPTRRAAEDAVAIAFTRIPVG